MPKRKASEDSRIAEFFQFVSNGSFSSTVVGVRLEGFVDVRHGFPSVMAASTST